MSHWDGKKTIRWQPHYAGKAGYYYIDCGCSAGLRWGGWEPVECEQCNAGWQCLNVKTGRLSEWPGGPFLGSVTKDELKHIKQRLCF